MNMQNELKAIRKHPTKVFRERVAAIKDRLPRNYRNILVSNYPEYDNRDGYLLIMNVVSLRTTDVDLTEILEKIDSGELKLKAA